MRRRLILGVIFLVGLAWAPQMLAAQDTGSDAPTRVKDSGFELHQNYPNPFNPNTRIPFTLGPSLFETGRPAVVSMRIFNVLQQLVAYPTALNHPAGDGVPVNGLEYDTPGQNEAFWDGVDLNGRPAAAGVYYLQLTVNGQRRIMTMIVSN